MDATECEEKKDAHTHTHLPTHTQNDTNLNVKGAKIEIHFFLLIFKLFANKRNDIGKNMSVQVQERRKEARGRKLKRKSQRITTTNTQNHSK